MYEMLISPDAFLFLLLSRSSKGSTGAVFTHQTVTVGTKADTARSFVPAPHLPGHIP